MEIDCVVTETLSCLVTLPTAAFERFTDSYLRSVSILGVVLDTVYILWVRRSTIQMLNEYVIEIFLRLRSAYTPGNSPDLHVHYAHRFK